MHNALAAHLRAVTKSRKITPAMDARIKRPVAQDLSIARGPMIPGLGNLGVQLKRGLGARLQGPQAHPIMRSRSLNLGIPVDQRVATPVTNRLPAAPGTFMPGFGDIDQMFGGLGSMDFVPGMGDDSDLAGQARASAHRKPILRKVQKPRIKGAPATTHATTAFNSFMPGLGEEEDNDIVAFGYLSASELADDAIPANTGAQAVAASTGALTKMMLVVGAALALGAFLRFR